MDVESIKNALENTLNGNILSINSIYGVLILIGIIWLVYRIIKRATHSVISLVAFILLLEIGHIVAFTTAVGSTIPILQNIFKYDVLTALAQLCVGTKVSEFLLYARAYIVLVLQTVGARLSWLWESFVNLRN